MERDTIMREPLRRALIVVVTALLGWGLLVSSMTAAEKPNVVIMMVDNLGWGELGVYGGGVLRGAETPRLDNLASEGIRFLNFGCD